ncbi:MAG: hypothetical protein MJY89_04470 [Bacteroidales bacterium]|nr:hypothetical protein [Bacteroidales bacterium]
MPEISHFNEINESFTLSEAITEAQRCIECKTPACKEACPIGNEIPTWIHELKKGNLGNSIAVIRQKSNLPAVCGRVCAHERQCEGSCVMGKMDKPISIGKLERFVADFDAEAHLTHDDIPEYRLPKEVVAREVRHIEAMGVIIHRSCHIGIDKSLNDLFYEGFDAVYMGTGLTSPNMLDIEGNDSKGVLWAIRFLTKNELFREGLASRDEINVGEGQKVYVIGGGKGGYVITRDFPYGMTSRRGVFAGGDVANRQATVVHAMHDAKMVAQGMDAMKIIESI